MSSVLFDVDTIEWNFRLNPSLEDRQAIVKSKLDGFFNRAIYPQTLTMPRDPLTTQEGSTLVRVFNGRKIDGVAENGIRCVVQKNIHNGTKTWAQFCMSPLFNNEHDAQGWARQNGVT